MQSMLCATARHAQHLTEELPANPRQYTGSREQTRTKPQQHGENKKSEHPGGCLSVASEAMYALSTCAFR